MPLEIIDASEIATKAGGRGGKERYGKYAKAVKSIVPWLDEKIADSPDGTIRVRIKDIAKEIGLESRTEYAIYWGLRFALFKNHNIYSDMKSDSQGNKILVMRIKREDDRLPISLEKYLTQTE